MARNTKNLNKDALKCARVIENKPKSKLVTGSRRQGRPEAQHADVKGMRVAHASDGARPLHTDDRLSLTQMLHSMLKCLRKSKRKRERKAMVKRLQKSLSRRNSQVQEKSFVPVQRGQRGMSPKNLNLSSDREQKSKRHTASDLEVIDLTGEVEIIDLTIEDDAIADQDIPASSPAKRPRVEARHERSQEHARTPSPVIATEAAAEPEVVALVEHGKSHTTPTKVSVDPQKRDSVAEANTESPTTGPPGTVLWYSSLDSAHESYKDFGQENFHRIMACDHHYYPVHGDESMVRITRKFTSANLNTAIGCQLLNMRSSSQRVFTPTLYEVIPAAEPIRLFAKFDLHLSRSVDHGAHEWLLGVIGRAVRRWLLAVWGSGTNQQGDKSVLDVLIAESCEGSTFSCQAVMGTWVADIEVQGRAAIASFAAYLQWYIQSNEGTGGEYSAEALIEAGRKKTERDPIGSPVEDLKLILEAAAVASFVGRLLDLSLYTANCQLRMLGSPKYKPGVGHFRYLLPTRTEIVRDELRVSMLPESEKHSWLGGYRRTCNETIAYMVIPGELWMERNTFYERDPRLSTETKLSRMIWFNINRTWVRFVEVAKLNPVNKENSFARTDPKTPVEWESCPKGVKVTSDILCSDKLMEGLLGTRLACCEPSGLNARMDAAVQDVVEDLVHQDGEFYHCVDTDEYVIDEIGQQKAASALREGDVCFCPQCETHSERKAGYESLFTRTRGLGTPSAVVIPVPGHNAKVIKCLKGSCLQSTFIVHLDLRSDMVIPDTIVRRDELSDGHLTLKSPESPHGIEFPRNKKLIIIDAPSGCGKTSTATEYIRTQFPAPASVVALTFRRNLAAALAHSLGISCYLDKDWAKDADLRKRTALCINSLPKLGVSEISPDMLMIDDASLFAGHMVSVTLNERTAKDCLALLHSLMQRTRGQILVVQQGVSEDTLHWWRALAHCAQSDVHHIKVDGQIPLQKALVLSAPPPARKGVIPMTRLHSLVEFIGARFLEHLKDPDEAGNPRNKIYIPVCGSKYSCVTIASHLSRVAREYSESRNESTRVTERRQMRIKALIDGSDDQWAAAFQGNPDVLAESIDVLVCTPIMFSVATTRFKTRIAFLQNLSLTHAEELQMISRLRMLRDQDRTPWDLLYIEEGYTGSYTIDSDCELPAKRVLREWDLLRTVKAMTENARADTACRHLELWREECRHSAVPWEDLGLDCWDERYQDNVLQKIAPKVFEARCNLQTGTSISSILQKATERSTFEATVAWAKKVTANPRERLTHLYAVPNLDAWYSGDEHRYGDLSIIDPTDSIPGFKRSLLFRGYDKSWIQQPGTNVLLRWVSNFDGYDDSTDVTPVLLPLATSSNPAKFKTEQGALEHRRSARVLAHVIDMCAISKDRNTFDPWDDYKVDTDISSRAQGIRYEPYQHLKAVHHKDFSRKENAFVSDVAPFVFELLVEQLGLLYRDAAHQNRWMLRTEPRYLPRRDTATDWVNGFIKQHPGRTRAFNALRDTFEGASTHEPVSAYYVSLSQSMLIQKLLKSVGLSIHLNAGAVELDVHRFFVSCVGLIPWLNVTESFFAQAFSDKVYLDTLRVYVMICATASLTGPLHGIKDRETMNTFIVHFLDPRGGTLPKDSKKISVSSKIVTSILVDQHVPEPYEPYALSLLTECQAASHFVHNRVEELRRLVCMLPRFVANEPIFVKQAHHSNTVYAVYPSHLVVDSKGYLRRSTGKTIGVSSAVNGSRSFESSSILEQVHGMSPAGPVEPLEPTHPLGVDMHGMRPVPLSDGASSLVVYYKRTRDGKAYKGTSPILAKRIDPSVRRVSDIPTVCELRAAIAGTKSHCSM